MLKLAEIKSFTGIDESRIKKLFILIFFISGACGLIYEVIWQKMLCLTFGNTTYATSAVVAAFMAGLALGSIYFGKKSDTLKQPLKTYAILEVGIGCFALLFPFINSYITVLYVEIIKHASISYFLINVIKFLFCFLVIIIPTFLMGGTLPIMSRIFIEKIENFGLGFGKLYAGNTLGAVVGCFSAGFVLTVFFGFNTAGFIAAAANIAIGLLMFWIGSIVHIEHDNIQKYNELKKIKKNIDINYAITYKPFVYRFILILSAVTGFCSMAYQVLWFRTLSFYLNNTIYAFPAMLTVFLLAYALGSLVYSYTGKKFKDSLFVLGAIESLIAILGLLSVREFSVLNDLVTQISGIFSGSWYGFIFKDFYGSVLIVFMPSLLMGIAFPHVCRIYTRSRGIIGQGVGSIYAYNTIGCVLGSILAGFVFIPFLGVTTSIIVIAFLNLAFGIVLILINFSKGYKLKLASAISLFLVAAILMLTFNPQSFQLGTFSSIFAEIGKNNKLLFYKEGVSGTVTVQQSIPDIYTNEMYKTIDVNSTPVAGTSPILRATQKIQAHVPLLLYKASTGKEPENVFTLGLGTGECSYSITLHDIKRLDCLELVSTEKESLPLFKELNHDILNNPKFHLMVNDARNQLLTTTTKYDVIESDSVHPETDIYTYTADYYRLCYNSLSENGIFSSWIPLFNLSDENFKIMLKTLQSVFPHVMIWYAPNSTNKHAIMIGTKSKLSIDFKLLEQEMEKKEIKVSLQQIQIGDVYQLLNCFLTDESILSKDNVSVLNTDNNLYLPFEIPKQELKGEQTTAGTLKLLNKAGKTFFEYLSNIERPEEVRAKLQKQLNAREHVINGLAGWFDFDYKSYSNELSQALKALPDNRLLVHMNEDASFSVELDKGFRLEAAGDSNGSIKYFLEAKKINPNSSRLNNVIGMAYYRQGDMANAEPYLKKAVELVPDYSGYREDLGIFYAVNNMNKEAKKELEICLSLSPDREGAIKMLKVLNKRP